MIIDNTGAGGGFLAENGTTPFAGEVVVGSVFVRGFARLAGDPNGDDLRLYSAEDVVIENSGLISVSEFVPFGSGQSPGQSGGASGGGGGHAGDGGFGGNNRFDGNGGAGGMEIGHPSLDPPTRGSGGGVSTAYGNPGGAGGGYLEVNAAGMLIVDGSLNADGSMGSSNAGGGSGGGILLRAGSISGVGTISAKGGDGGLGAAIFGGTAGGGGGSGGRIAWASCDGLLGGGLSIMLEGGIGGVGKAPGGEGDNGTIFQRGDYSTIRRDPTSVVAEFGGVAELVFVAPTGAGSTYQWFREGQALVDGPTPHGSVITGANTPVLVVLSTRDEDEARYSCVAMGPCGSLTSNLAWIYVGEAPPCPGDVNGDGVVNFTDLNAVLSAFGATSADPNFNAGADFDGDGDVDFADLNTVLAAFNSMC